MLATGSFAMALLVVHATIDLLRGREEGGVKSWFQAGTNTHPCHLDHWKAAALIVHLHIISWSGVSPRQSRLANSPSADSKITQREHWDRSHKTSRGTLSETNPWLVSQSGNILVSQCHFWDNNRIQPYNFFNYNRDPSENEQEMALYAHEEENRTYVSEIWRSFETLAGILPREVEEADSAIQLMRLLY